MLGDVIHHALSLVGITPETIESFLGRECHCEERRQKLNAVTFWAKRVTAGKVAHAREYLERIMRDAE